MRHRSARLRIPVLAVVSLVMAATLLPVQAAAAAPSNVVLNWNATAAAALFNAPTAVPPGAGQATPVAAIHMARDTSSEKVTWSRRPSELIYFLPVRKKGSDCTTRASSPD